MGRGFKEKKKTMIKPNKGLLSGDRKVRSAVACRASRQQKGAILAVTSPSPVSACESPLTLHLVIVQDPLTHVTASIPTHGNESWY